MTEAEIARAMEEAREPGRVLREFVSYAGEHVQVRVMPEGVVMLQMRGGDEGLEFFFALELRPNEARTLAVGLVEAHDHALGIVRP